jgi:hypothetical protein
MQAHHSSNQMVAAYQHAQVRCFKEQPRVLIGAVFFSHSLSGTTRQYVMGGSDYTE